MSKVNPTVRGIWKKSFDSVDVDKSGEIDCSELTKLFELMSWDSSPKNVTRCLQFLDKDNNGTIEFDEFMKWGEYTWKHQVLNHKRHGSIKASGVKVKKNTFTPGFGLMSEGFSPLNEGREIEEDGEEKSSAIPTVTTSRQAAVVNLPLNTVWKRIRPCTFEWQTSIVVGSNKSGTSTTIEYKDGTKQTIEPTEISDKSYSVSWSMIISDPPVTYTSRDDTITLTEITCPGEGVKAQTLIEWNSEFSNDVDVAVIEDGNLKKKDAFKDLQN